MKLLKRIEKSFPTIEKLFDENLLIEFANSDFASLPNDYVRLNVLLCNSLFAENRRLYDELKKYGVYRIDDVSEFIVNLFYIYLKEKYMR